MIMLLLLLLLTSGALSQEPVKAVATFSILADFIKNVGGDLVDLRVLVGPDSDAHDYEPTPQDSVAIAEAKLLFENGLEFESWLDDLYKASGSVAQRVVVTQGIVPRAMTAGEHDHTGEHDHAGHQDHMTSTAGVDVHHACKHMLEGPAKSLIALPKQEETLYRVDGVHTRYDTQLSNFQNAKGGFFNYYTETAGDYIFYLNDSAVQLVMNSNNTAIDAEEQLGPDELEDCAEIKSAYIFPLQKGENTLMISGASAANISIVIESLAQAHEQADEHASGEAHSETEPVDAEKAEHTGHDHGEFDPHVWQNPQLVMTMVDNIAAALSQVDPAHEASYRANAEAYKSALQQLDKDIQAEVNKLPREKRKLVTNHEAIGYFAYRYGFEVIGTVIPSVTTESSDAGAGELAALIEEIKASGMSAIFVENMAGTRLIEQVASAAGVNVAPELYTDALGEEGTEGATYLSMMRYNARTIVEALSKD